MFLSRSIVGCAKRGCFCALLHLFFVCVRLCLLCFKHVTYSRKLLTDACVCWYHRRAAERGDDYDAMPADFRIGVFLRKEYVERSPDVWRPRTLRVNRDDVAPSLEFALFLTVRAVRPDSLTGAAAAAARVNEVATEAKRSDCDAAAAAAEPKRVQL